MSLVPRAAAFTQALKRHSVTIGSKAQVVMGGGAPVVVQSMTNTCLLYTSPSPRDGLLSRMPSSA